MAKKRLDVSQMSPEGEELLLYLNSRVLFQERAVSSVVKSYLHGCSPLRSNNLPIASFLFLGPSGVGKTETAHALAEFLFEDRNGFTLINGSEYSERHTVSGLVGSPRGYIGSDEDPLLSQRHIDSYDMRYQLESQKSYVAIQETENELRAVKEEIRGLLAQKDPESVKMAQQLSARVSHLRQEMATLTSLVIEECNGFRSILLFDEFEKAHKSVWNILLQILSEGIVDLRNGQRTSFRNSIIILTSNIGSREMARITKGVSSIGFGETYSSIKDNLYHSALGAAREIIPTELMGRIGKIEVFRPLSKANLHHIVAQKIKHLTESIIQSEFPFQLQITKEAQEFILQRSCDHPEEGARLIEKKLRKYIEEKIDALILSEQIEYGDTVIVDCDENKSSLTFSQDVNDNEVDVDFVRRIVKNSKPYSK